MQHQLPALAFTGSNIIDCRPEAAAVDVGHVEAAAFAYIRPDFDVPLKRRSARGDPCILGGKSECMFDYSAAAIAGPVRKVALGLPGTAVGKAEARFLFAARGWHFEAGH